MGAELLAGPARAGCSRGVAGVGSRRRAPLPLGPCVGWGCRSDRDDLNTEYSADQIPGTDLRLVYEAIRSHWKQR